MSFDSRNLKAFILVVWFAWTLGGSAIAAGSPRGDEPDHPQHEAQEATQTNAMCPVMTDEPIDPEIYIDYNGRRVYFCCTRCRRSFERDPEPYLINLASFSQSQSDDSHIDETSESGSDDGHDHDAPSGEHANGDDQAHTHEHDQPSTAAMPKFLEWLGRFHPATVHFPIGLLVAAALAELLGLITRRSSYSSTARFCLWLGALGAILAGGLGWLFGGFHLVDDDWILTTHRWVGTSTAVLAIVALIASEAHHRNVASRSAARWYFLTLFIAAGLVTASGFFGGAMLYGIDHYMW